MLRSQGFCPGMLAVIVLISITASVPIPSPVSPLSWSLLPWPMPGSHNVELLESTLKPQKKKKVRGALKSCMWQEGGPGL